MRHSDVYQLSKLLLPRLPGFVTDKKDNLFMAPIGDVLRGFLFESTPGPREDFYFWWFFMPIGRPVDYLTLGYGTRLNVPGGHAGWRTDMGDLPDKLLMAMRPKALPFLTSIHTHNDVTNAIRKLAGKQAQTDTNMLDDISCIQILDGQYEEARRTLDALIAHEFGDDRRRWILDIVERAKGLRKKLLKDPKLALAQVKEWQDFTFKALKLEKWR
jgi:hypothetical protein